MGQWTLGVAAVGEGRWGIGEIDFERIPLFLGVSGSLCKGGDGDWCPWSDGESGGKTAGTGGASSGASASSKKVPTAADSNCAVFVVGVRCNNSAVNEHWLLFCGRRGLGGWMLGGLGSLIAVIPDFPSPYGLTPVVGGAVVVVGDWGFDVSPVTRPMDRCGVARCHWMLSGLLSW